jgi:hypothetical protein
VKENKNNNIGKVYTAGEKKMFLFSLVAKEKECSSAIFILK